MADNLERSSGGIYARVKYIIMTLCFLVWVPSGFVSSRSSVYTMICKALGSPWNTAWFLDNHHRRHPFCSHHFWLDDNKEEFYDLNGYSSVNRYRQNKKGGGVWLHIQNGIPFILRNDLDYFDSEMETVFIEIDKCIFNTDSNIVIGIIYRMPNS